ncbi:DUF2339 domain-containing protein [Alsobacter sp. SYSU M60028]|uniref:DUF2339 domain-containing protein n=1 Tax=Alsobacter ponti TaxID=2962936 RepID=A0ABT1LC38_9HYPH|nr:DUF2339 domain-containing protein [Alsobacter ponti]MCP8939052.1 DUF2339 domain-containing protein [Alsobacter ponti]
MVVLVLIALAIPILGLVGFFRTLRLSARADMLEARVRDLEWRLAGVAGPAPAVETPETPITSPEAAAAPEDEEEEAPVVPGPPEAETPPAGAPGEPVPPSPETFAPGEAPEPLRPAARAASFEELAGTRWAVWLGGVALGLGGLFLVRYSIEQGWFGPGARIAAGVLFALALLAGGEWMRRREGRDGTLVGIPEAHIPSVLTAAGTLTAFGTVYAAHALYDMIGPATAFVLLGAIGLGTMAAAALHGPALAGFGLLGAYVSPLLVSSAEPRVWPVALYLLVVTASADALARLRGWLWLALAAVGGAAFWALAMTAFDYGEIGARMTYLVAQAALAAATLGVLPYRGVEDRDSMRPDVPALVCLLVFALLAAGLLADLGLGAGRAPFTFAMAGVLFGAALVSAPVAGAAPMAAGVAAAALVFWPVARQAAMEGPLVLPGPVATPPLPDAVFLFIAVATALAAAFAGGVLVRLARGPRLGVFAACFYAAAGVVGPLAILVASWWRISDFDRSLPFGLVAGATAIAFTVAAGWLRPRALEQNALPAWLGFESYAAGALAALALGLTMVLDKGMLTVALALAALGAAWVTTRQPLGLLRYAVGATGVVVIVRLLWNTLLIRVDVGSTPIFNWLLFAYGVPAFAFAASSVLLRRQRDDEVVKLCEGLAIALTSLLVLFEIRHAVTGSVISVRAGHVEVGMEVAAGLLLSLALARLETVRRSVVLRGGGYVLAGLSMLGGLALIGPAVNPLLARSDVVAGGALVNSLLLGYLAPALCAFALAATARERWSPTLVQAATALGGILQFVWTVAEIRRLFQGERIGIRWPTGDAELYTYSAVFLLIGLVLLGWGIVRRSRTARLVSAAYVVLAIVKVFLVDMQGLAGVYRALSFIGLGLVLVAIGLVYQKLIFARAPAADAPPPETA